MVDGQDTFLYIFQVRNMLQDIWIFLCNQLWSVLLWLYSTLKKYLFIFSTNNENILLVKCLVSRAWRDLGISSPFVSQLKQVQNDQNEVSGARLELSSLKPRPAVFSSAITSSSLMQLDPPAPLSTQSSPSSFNIGHIYICISCWLPLCCDSGHGSPTTTQIPLIPN